MNAPIATLDILIADDHEAMRMLLARAFTRAGAARVRVAASAPEALVSLAERPADLVLVDHRMPGMSGLEFIAAVRADARYGAPRIVMISGDGAAAHADAARAAGADQVLVKPVSPSALLAAIEELFV